MNRITFSREGEIRPAAVVLVGLALSAIAFALDMLIATAAPSAIGALVEAPALGLITVLMMSVGRGLNILCLCTKLRDPGCGVGSTPSPM